MRLTLALGIAFLMGSPLVGQPTVAPTEALSPEQERKALQVPEGFEVQLVAAEPQIQKPIQMAFDARGRLWVTTSHHYPFAAPHGQGRDKLFVLSDIGADGKAGTVTVFADFLNIPIGILPLPDCRSCIVSSAGEILKLTDTNGDGRADRTEVLFTGFGTVDTHGMYNSFTLMPDGWIYACHGFKNISTVKGKDGHSVTMNSGNTFRFRPDGSRIEVYSRGQVNPFGMTVDPWFNLYTADCHSKPITQVIPGAFYSSFGAPHDGLGFGPHVTSHSHGSTALCGLAWYDADHFPREYLGCLFLGNVVTNKVNFDRIEWRGSTPIAIEQPDFVVSKDPWFRPADIKLGLDGALYVADFYNRIIGHYEVPLNHPLRDKDRGRIWRIIWKGKDGSAKPPAFPVDITRTTDQQLPELLEHPNIAVRLLASERLYGLGDDHLLEFFLTNRLRTSRGWATFPMIADRTLDPTSGPDGFIIAVYDRFRRRANDPFAGELPAGIARNRAARPAWNDSSREIIKLILSETNPKSRRSAVEAIIFHPGSEWIPRLIEVIEQTPDEDTHLKHSARIALRNSVAAPGGWKAVPDASATVADIALGIPTAESAAYLTRGVVARNGDVARLPAMVEHIARYGVESDRDRLITLAANLKDWRKQHTTVLALQKGIAARGQTLRPAEQQFAARVVTTGLADADAKIAIESCELAGGLRLSITRPQLLTLASDRSRPETVRAAALTAILAIDPRSAIPVLQAAATDAGNSIGLRERAGLLLGSIYSPEGLAASRAALKLVPYRVTVALAAGLAGSKPGAESLLEAIKVGEVSPRVLQEKTVIERLRTSGLPGVEARVGDLTKGLPPADAKITSLIQTRAAEFAAANPNVELGAKLYAKHCSACHQIAGQGGKVGPNLDGIGGRGPERLLEDLLDPNRNVDLAFRARVITLTNGTTKTGLKLRVEGEVMVLADDQGKEFRVALKDIEQERETNLSPMPANFGEVISPEEFPHLLAYLLNQRAKM